MELVEKEKKKETAEGTQMQKEICTKDRRPKKNVLLPEVFLQWICSHYMVTYCKPRMDDTRKEDQSLEMANAMQPTRIELITKFPA